MRCDSSFTISWKTVSLFRQSQWWKGRVEGWWEVDPQSAALSLCWDWPSDAGTISPVKYNLKANDLNVYSLSCASQVKQQWIHYRCDHIAYLKFRNIYISKWPKQQCIGQGNSNKANMWWGCFGPLAYCTNLITKELFLIGSCCKAMYFLSHVKKIIRIWTVDIGFHFD